MKNSGILSTLLSVSTAAVFMTGISASASAEASLFDCEVSVDAYDKLVTVSLEGDTVPEDAYTLIFFSYTPTEDGESLERAGTEFPTAEGTYIATVTAKDGSGYTDAGRSEPFTISAAQGSAVQGKDISNGEVSVDTYDKLVTVSLEGDTVPESGYHVIFFSYTPTETGESLERVGTDFPTAPGTYIAAVVANEDSEYTGENRSEPFTIKGESYDLSDSIVYVTTESKLVTVRIQGGLVSSDNYHVIFFSYTPTETGESLERVGTDFPTAPGTYIAAVVANEGSEFSGENRSDPFTIEAVTETNPKTGSELPGLAAFIVSAAAVVIAAKKKLK